jgi:hypothetical protein
LAFGLAGYESVELDLDGGYLRSIVSMLSTMIVSLVTRLMKLCFIVESTAYKPRQMEQFIVLE